MHVSLPTSQALPYKRDEIYLVKEKQIIILCFPTDQVFPTDLCKNVVFVLTAFFFRGLHR